MIMEERIYTFAPGKLQPYIARFVVEALPIMRRHLGEPVGCFVTESGDLNQLVHLWRYQSMADREIRRAAMYKDPDWLDYIERAAQDRRVDHQHTRLLRSIELPAAG